MDTSRILKHSRPVPRYTSYPTAPHFHDGIGANTYAHWLRQLPPETPLSIYIHIPFCDTLCWFCGCHMQVVRDIRPVASYVRLLLQEIGLLARALGDVRRPIAHLHFGGGSPCLLPPEEIDRVAEGLWQHFQPTPDAEIAVEMDPRDLRPEVVEAFARLGVNRASIGVQDLNAEVQLAINRWQPFDVVAGAAERIRAAGIRQLNVDLMYGLPYQSHERVLATAEKVLRLQPDRLALFGYAHVPHMKRHQRLLPEEALPGEQARLEQSEAAARWLVDAGYRRIGLDHFARPGDPLALAHDQGRLQRNFQGYTVDEAPILLGLGVSAIGSLAQGYVQNVPGVPEYRQALREERLPIFRGVEISAADRQDREIIHRLMCDFRIDLGSYGGVRQFPDVCARLAALIADDLVALNGDVLEIQPEGRPLVRVVAAAFDRYLYTGGARHSAAI